MSSLSLPENCSKQWEILLLLISSEEKKIDRTGDSEIDTMNYFYKNEGIRQILLQWLNQMKATYAKKRSESDTATKCDEIALLWRQKGNDKFRSNNIEASYSYYSKSVTYANQTGPMYPLALANRSAALLRLKRNEDCLSDIKLAISNGYPSELRHKLLLRRADCLIELCRTVAAREALIEAKQHAATLKLSMSHKGEFDRHLCDLEKKLEVVKDVDRSEEDEIPDFYMGENEEFVSASNALQLKRSKAAGRHVVTKKATKRGDVIFSEEPYACVTLPNEGGRLVCETCCRTDINTVPCSVCSRSCYCSETCREHGLHTFHRWECPGAQFDLFPTIGIAHLALRVLLVSVSAGFPQLPLGARTPTSASDLFNGYANVDNVQIYTRDTPPFYRMFNLVTNFDKMNSTDYIQYALTATMLTLYLENFTTFFDDLPDKIPYTLNKSQLRLFSASLLLRSLGQLVCNGHAALSLATIEEDDAKAGRTISEREVRRATAIYPSAAMMNHSCDPNIVNTFYNSRLIVRCSREMPVATEVFNCYGPHRSRETTAQRRAQLRAQYMFNCMCTACLDTDRKDFVSLFTAYACQTCKGPVLWCGKRALCQQCHAELQIDRALSAIEKAEDLMDQAERAATVEERFEKAHAAYKMKQQVWHRHHTSLRAAADRLARIYADSGEFSRSVELIKQNIQSLEYQFGSFSVEVAHELRKLSDVMLERLINLPQSPEYREWCLEAHKIIKKSIQLMDLNYGSWEPLVKRLKEQESIVASLLAHSRTPEHSDTIHNNLHYNLKI
ncbi:SET and MYND domain-containing protein 4 [Bombyx mori]|uniref:Protein-lysine N-methyltransferase SMYD4 n=2 Tax=Bombyx mori TaxID=7091 RepID=A0A8R2R7I2_BOMMO|nr:SET and MYND domain-containing protein 4 isoform X1 [Bombyx mori]